MLYNHRRISVNANKTKKKQNKTDIIKCKIRMFLSVDSLQMWVDYRARYPNNVTYIHKFSLDNFPAVAFDSHVEFDQELPDWSCLQNISTFI